MRLSTKLLFIFVLSAAQGLLAASMRKCMLLPVVYEETDETAFKVFEDVEDYLKKAQWCLYKPNSDILNIIQSFPQGLGENLHNQKVLKLIAEKTGAGSLIRIRLENIIKGIKLSLAVIGSNGEDVYFHREKALANKDLLAISQSLREWLSSYEHHIPYDALVVGVLQDQFSVDMGKHYGLTQGNRVVIKKSLNKRLHPLLKEIISWDEQVIAKGNIFHASENSAQGRATEYTSKEKIHPGYWVSILKEEEKPKESQAYFEDNDYKFGRIGYLRMLFEVGPGTAGTNLDGTNTNTFKSLNLGGDIRLELWITRNFFSSFEIGKFFGKYEQDDGGGNSSLDASSMSFAFGYKYLPLGFFYGPQVNTYFGYSRKSYGFDTRTNDGLTDFRFKGFLFGIDGSMPIVRNFRTSIELGFIFKPSFEENTTIYGNKDTSSHSFITLGGQYSYNPALAFDIQFGIHSSEAQFTSPTRELKIQRTTLKVGTTYTF